MAVTNGVVRRPPNDAPSQFFVWVIREQSTNDVWGHYSMALLDPGWAPSFTSITLLPGILGKSFYTRMIAVSSGGSLSFGKVGSKGELFPPKKLRLKIGLKEGQNVLYRVVGGRLIVERLLEIEEVLAKPSKVTVSFKELKEDRLQLSEDASK